MAGSFCTPWQVKWKNSRLKEVSSVVYTLVYNVMSGRKINKTAQRIEFPRDEVILFLAGELHMYIVGANFRTPRTTHIPLIFAVNFEGQRFSGKPWKTHSFTHTHAHVSKSRGRGGSVGKRETFLQQLELSTLQSVALTEEFFTLSHTFYILFWILRPFSRQVWLKFLSKRLQIVANLAKIILHSIFMHTHTHTLTCRRKECGYAKESGKLQLHFPLFLWSLPTGRAI